MPRRYARKRRGGYAANDQASLVHRLRTRWSADAATRTEMEHKVRDLVALRQMIDARADSESDSNVNTIFHAENDVAAAALFDETDNTRLSQGEIESDWASPASFMFMNSLSPYDVQDCIEALALSRQLKGGAEAGSCPVEASMPMEGSSVLDVLIIEGMNNIGADANWMKDSLLAGSDFRGLRYKVVNFEYGESVEAVDACVAAIRDLRSSPLRNSVVIADLSSDFDAFQRLLGPPLQSYAQAGGRVAFLSCEGLLLQPVLARLFGTRWRSSSYHRTTWYPAAAARGALDSTFTGMIEAAPFSAKACSVKGVPPEERLFIATRESRTQSLVPAMAGNAVGAGEDPEVCVAVRKYGLGSIAYFGDVNMESETAMLVEGYCRRCDSEPRAPVTSAQPQSAPPGVPGGVSEGQEAGLCKGAKALIRGLQAAAKHNGQCGELLKFDSGKGRWDVRLFTGGGLSVKPANLRPIPHQRRALVVSDIGIGREGTVPKLARAITAKCGSVQNILLGDVQRMLSGMHTPSKSPIDPVKEPDI